MSTAKNPREQDRIAASAKTLASMLGVSERFIFKLNAQKKIPRPFRLGRAVRWDRAEIEAWIAAGAPPRDKWEGLKAERRAS